MLPVIPHTQTPQEITLPAEGSGLPVVETQEETVTAPLMHDLSDNEVLDQLACPHFPWPAGCPREACARIANMAPRNLPEQNGFVLEWLQECAKRNHPGLTEHEKILLAAQLFLRYKFGFSNGSAIGINLHHVCKIAKKEGEETAERLLSILISTPNIDVNGLYIILKRILDCNNYDQIQEFLIAFNFFTMDPRWSYEDLEVEDITAIVNDLAKSPLLFQEEALFEDMLQHNPLVFLPLWPNLSTRQQDRVRETLRSLLQNNLPYLMTNAGLLKDLLPEVIALDDVFTAVLEKMKGQENNEDILQCIDILFESDIAPSHLIDKVIPMLVDIPPKFLHTILDNPFVHPQKTYKIVAKLHELGATDRLKDSILDALLASIFPLLKDHNQLHWFVDFIEHTSDQRPDILFGLTQKLSDSSKEILLSTLLNGSAALRNRCLDCGLWKLDPDLVLRICDTDTLLEHAPEILPEPPMSPELKERWLSALLQKDCDPEVLMHVGFDTQATLVTHFLENHPEKFCPNKSYSIIDRLYQQNAQRVISHLIEKQPLLAWKLNLSTNQRNQLFEILLNTSPLALFDETVGYLSKEQKLRALKKLAEIDPQEALKHLSTELCIKDFNKEAATILCAVYFETCHLQDRSPELMRTLLNRCATYLDTHGVSPTLGRQAAHRKLFHILLDGLEFHITQEDKQHLEYLLADRTFKDYRNNREQIWKILLLLVDAPLSVKNKRSIIHFLAGENTGDFRSEQAQQLIKRANTLLLLRIIPNGLEQYEHPNQAIAHFMQTMLPSMPEDFLEHYLRTFHTWDDPNALIQYVSTLYHSIPPCPDKDQLLDCCTRFIQAIFNGPAQWKALRGIKTAHMDEVERLSSPRLLEMWAQELSVPMSQLVPSPEEGPAVLDLKKIFHTALITDAHLPHLETLLPRLHALLTEAPQPIVSPPGPLQTLEDLLIESILNQKAPTIEMLKKIEQMIHTIPEVAGSQFARDVHDLIQQLNKASVKPTCTLQVAETDDPEMLFLAPTIIPGSCQSVYAGPVTNSCLMGYVLDPKNRTIVVKTPDGKPVARSILRILITSEYNTITNTITRSGPALFLERLYPPVLEPQIKEAIIAMAKLKADRLGIPLHISHQTLPPKTAFCGEKLLVSIGSAAPFEYADSALPSLDPAQGVAIPTHINRGCYYVPQNEVDTTPGERVPAYGPA